MMRAQFLGSDNGRINCSVHCRLSLSRGPESHQWLSICIIKANYVEISTELIKLENACLSNSAIHKQESTPVNILALNEYNPHLNDLDRLYSCERHLT